MSSTTIHFRIQISTALQIMRRECNAVLIHSSRMNNREWRLRVIPQTKCSRIGCFFIRMSLGLGVQIRFIQRATSLMMPYRSSIKGVTEQKPHSIGNWGKHYLSTLWNHPALEKLLKFYYKMFFLYITFIPTRRY